MVEADWFKDLPDNFEESVRIDRDQQDHRRRAIQSYHVTTDSKRFIGDSVDRMLDQADDMRAGSNYWLYGYYGSGKSHLLTVLDGLLDTDWVAGQEDAVWSDLVEVSGDNDSDQLGDQWRTIHDEYYVIPISVNLLKYQGQKQRSFSEIVLRHAHKDADLTGVDDGISEGLSTQVDVAYFEKWFRTTDAWSDREKRAKAALDKITAGSSDYDWGSESLWKDIQRYGVLADVILPKLFEEINGTRDGYTDLQPSDIDPEEVVSRLEQLRTDRENELGRPVKLVLLLDEVSLFIGTKFERLTELQTLAENVDDIGDGDIQLVATAQAKIEDVQPKFAAHGADFSIVKDRFPHRYQLPSKHVGDIAKRRLFEKSATGEREIKEVLGSASIKPTESLVYKDIKQNTKPPLDSIDDKEIFDFYPFLPYHAPLFLEILFNLRQEANDPAKSIFSGTARAILALMHNLMQTWIENGEADQVITLVDFYELVKPELREILKQDMHVIEGSDTSGGIKDEVESGRLEEFDLAVAKAVLLLQHVHDIVPLNEGNIAVSVMSDLNGRSWIGTQNEVEDSLDRLQKFIRPTEDETGARYRFATQEERIIYDDTEVNEANPDWDAILYALDKHLWERITQELSLPESVPYGESGDEYPIAYDFRLDGVEFKTTIDAEGGLDVPIEIQGLHPHTTSEYRDEKTLYWSIDTEGLKDLRKHLIKWWALRDAISTQTAPPAVERDLEQRATAVRSKLVSVMQRGSYAVKDRTNINGLTTAVQTAVDVGYPDDFHPMMLQVTDDRLQELTELSAGDPLPLWAHTIQVPTSDPSSNRGGKTIQGNVRSLTARQIKDQDNGLNMNTVLDELISEKEGLWDDARGALCAIIWGFCQKGQFVPVDESGNALENSVVLDPDQLSKTRLKLLRYESIGKLLEAGGFKKTTETISDGLITLQQANQQLHSRLIGFKQDVQLVVDTDVQSDEVSALLDRLIEELTNQISTTSDRLSVVRSQGDGLGDAIEQTNDVQVWFDEVQDVWHRRLGSLYRFDAQLTVSDDRFEWIDAETLSEVATQREVLRNFEGSWWTTDGWKNLIGDTVTGLNKEFERSWNTYAERQGLTGLIERIDDHSWIIPATKLPTGVQVALEREYITPLRELQQWYETIDGVISVLSSDDEDALVAATNEIVSAESLAGGDKHEIKELESRLARLTAIVGNRTPDEVDQLGVIPDDRQGIDLHLARLIENRALDVEVTDSGVIIR